LPENVHFYRPLICGAAAGGASQQGRTDPVAAIRILGTIGETRRLHAASDGRKAGFDPHKKRLTLLCSKVEEAGISRYFKALKPLWAALQKIVARKLVLLVEISAHFHNETGPVSLISKFYYARRPEGTS
jgi:hypothetical protein